MKNRGRRTWGWALGLSVVLALMVGVAIAKGKPPKPPPEPDTSCIYYWVGNAWDSMVELWVMDTDGTNKTKLTDLGGVPSLELHGGERWFLEERELAGEAKYPDGRKVRELFAYNESKTITVQLTDDPLREIHKDAKYGGTTWTPGDQAISWPARTWEYDPDTQTYAVAEAGIYYLDLEYDSDGNILEPDSSSEPLVAVYGDLGFATWSPDNTRVVHGRAGNEIWVTNVTTHATYYLTQGIGPRWSAADVIGFAWDGIQIINPDGSGQTKLHSVRSGTSMSAPHFAPDGIRFAFMVYYPPSPNELPGTEGTTKIYKSSILKPQQKDLRTEGSYVQWR